MKTFYFIVIIISLLTILCTFLYIGFSNLTGKILLAISSGFLISNLLNLFSINKKRDK